MDTSSSGYAAKPHSIVPPLPPPEATALPSPPKRPDVVLVPYRPSLWASTVGYAVVTTVALSPA